MLFLNPNSSANKKRKITFKNNQNYASVEDEVEDEEVIQLNRSSPHKTYTYVPKSLKASVSDNQTRSWSPTLSIEGHKIPIEKLLRSPKQSKNEPINDLKTTCTNILNEVLERKPTSVKTFVTSQIVHKDRTKWSAEEKELYLKFHYKSPSFYKFLKKEGFLLPSQKTLSRWYDVLPFGTGISKNILYMLKQKLKDLPANNRKCVLVFDEMSTKVELEYNSKEDIIYGFEDLGEFGRNKNMANHCLLLMLRGLNQSWKQVRQLKYLSKLIAAIVILTGLKQIPIDVVNFLNFFIRRQSIASQSLIEHIRIMFFPP